MNLGWYANVLVHRPYVIVSAVAVVSVTCIIILFTLKPTAFPNFQDPQLGFSTRGTVISNRLTAWQNLLKELKPSGNLVANPKEYLFSRNRPTPSFKTKPTIKKHRKRKKNNKISPEPVYGSITMQKEEDSVVVTEDINRWKAIQNLTPSPFNKTSAPIVTDNFFCGNPDERYAHLVVTSKNGENLFTLDYMLQMCRLEQKLISLNHFSDLCIENTHLKSTCCKPWSIPNYIAILNNKPSCSLLTEEDMDHMKNLLLRCAMYFHHFQLGAECLKSSVSCELPIECIRHEAVYNVLNYLSSTSFLPPNYTQTDTILKEAMIFLPLAGSVGILPYYHEVEKLNLEFDGLKVVAMDFRIKNVLFDEYLIFDAAFIGFGATFVIICIWLYTHSLFLTFMTIFLVIFSLAISYFIYILVFEINFFPFMNILAVVVAIGIGSDDAFIFCKIWDIEKQKQEQGGSLLKIMTDTFHHAFISMLVTSVTTSVAFFGTFVSSVTAVSCFSIFAGTAVIANYFLMMTWFPACLVIWEKTCFSKEDFFRCCLVMSSQKWCCIKAQWNISTAWFGCSFLRKIWNQKEKWLIDTVIRLRYLWLFLLLTLAIASGVVVFIYPKLQLPDSNEFPLFISTHPFEQYDWIYKNLFQFSKSQQLGEENLKLPLRFVWGVLPIDNGNHLNPSDFGTLTFDPNFDISDPKSQEWLKNFCQNLRQQPFYQSRFGPLLANCFIETFMSSMQRKCHDSFRNKDLTPCCEKSKFPFSKSTFEECIVDEMAELYETPSDLLSYTDAGPKFSKDQNPTIKAVVVEYDSTYSYTMSFKMMHEFYTQVEEWMKEQLKTAPEPMKNGWFISDLQFYDLQRELSVSTEITIFISMGLALTVLFFSTLNVVTSLYAIITIFCSIIVTMAVLVIMGWKLNVLESVATSVAIGLTVDFSLHYSVNYRLCSESTESRELATRYALSRMAGPAFMAAVTTGAAGAFMLPSLILPYIQIGIFLLLVMSISWIYATFLLGSMLAIGGPDKNCGQFKYPKLNCCINKSERIQERAQPRPTNILDSHELESLTLSKHERSTPKPLKRSLSSGGAKFTPSKYLFTDQSPSATSAITIIMTDDN